MRKLLATLAGAALLMASTSAMATIVNPLGGGNGSELNMQEILNGITTGPVSGASSVNAYTDFIQDGGDALWKIGGTGIGSSTMIIEIAGWSGSNQFGIYDNTDINNKAVLFNGAASAGSKVVVTFDDALNLSVFTLSAPPSYNNYQFGSATFGFYFTNALNQTFYSDTTRNADQYDHMVAYAGKGDSVQVPNTSGGPWLDNEYVLGFEDTLRGGDHDYNDMVLMIESVAPVPEPGTMLLLGAGFLGLAIYGKRRKNA